jgi:hypothetical protein
MKKIFMKNLLSVVVPGILFIISGASSSQGQSPVFTCDTITAVFDPGLTAEQQRQHRIVVSGVVSVNCGATREYTMELTDEIMKVTLATHGPCACPDLPCRIELNFSTGVSEVSRVTVMTAENEILLDTSFVQTGLAGSHKTIEKSEPSGTVKIFDLRGRALSTEGERPLDMRRTRLPCGVYLMHCKTEAGSFTKPLLLRIATGN